MIITAIIDDTGNLLTSSVAGTLLAMSVGTEAQVIPGVAVPFHNPGSEWQALDAAMEPNRLKPRY